MNYLAHAYLSFDNDEILLGNMISDFVKGRKQFDYSSVVHKGIVLHRHIDAFTDSHPIIQKAKTVFRTDYRLYSGAFIDVVFDHFLAVDANEFSKNELYNFSQKTYDTLDRQDVIMPPSFRNMFYHMKFQNWLYGYRTREGMYRSFDGLVKRAAYLEDSSAAVNVFDNQYNFLKNCYISFWPELKSYAKNKYKELLQN